MMSANGKELMRMLKEIKNDHDFVCGIMSNAANESGWQMLTDYLLEAKKQGETPTVEKLIALSVIAGEQEQYMAAAI